MKAFLISIEKKASRYPYLSLALLSSALGTALAYGDGIQHWGPAIFSLFLIWFIFYIFTVTKISKKGYGFLSSVPRVHLTTMTLGLGPFCLSGTYFLQSHEINPAIILSGFIPGFWAAGWGLLSGDLKLFPLAKESREKMGSFFITLLFAVTLWPILIYMLTLDHLKTLFSLVALFPAKSLLLNLSGMGVVAAASSKKRLFLRIIFLHAALFAWGWIF